jgi:hypothetical protein
MGYKPSASFVKTERSWFYYGFLKHKWLDLMSFAKALLAPDHDKPGNFYV